MKKLKPVLIALTTLFVVALVGLAVWSAMTLRSPIATLPDGTTVELLGTTVGSQTFTTEKPWEKFARRILPQRFQPWIPSAYTSTCSSGSNSVTVFFRVAAPAGQTLSQMPWVGYVPVDSSGFYLSGGGSSSCSSGAGSSMIYGLILRSLPRRQKTFELRFLGQTNLLATFTVPTPIFAPFAEWTPDPLPITRTNGPLTVTLESLADAGSKDYRRLGAQWRVDSTDPLWKNAKPSWITASDATGNENQFLFPGEPAWKLNTLVHRRNPEEFADSEKFTLRDLKTPADGEIVAIDQSHQAAGVKVSVDWFTAPGRVTITNDLAPVLDPSQAGNFGNGTGSSYTNSYRYWTSPGAALMIHADGADRNDEIRFTLHDPEGTEIKTENNGYSTESSGRREYLVRLAKPIVAKTISLEVIVSHPLEFEFTVDPKEIRAAAQ
jgi:hypothetical protein